MTNKVASIVNERLLAALKEGTVPWRKPWRIAGQRYANLVSKRPYRGVNVFLLALMGFESPWFLSFKQARDLGGAVKKGAKGIPVVFWTFLPEKNPKDPAKPKRIPFLRYYTVFNALEHCEGLEEKIPAPPEVDKPLAPIDSAEALATHYLGDLGGPELSIGGDRACYSPVLDMIRVPKLSRFDASPEYYGTLFHELVHSTGHEKRLDRDCFKAIKAWGDMDYSREELVAEIGANYLLEVAGLPNSTGNSAAYLKGWVDAVDKDPLIFVTAATRAERAANCILGISEEVADDTATTQEASDEA